MILWPALVEKLLTLIHRLIPLNMLPAILSNLHDLTAQCFRDLLLLLDDVLANTNVLSHDGLFLYDEPFLNHRHDCFVGIVRAAAVVLIRGNMLDYGFLMRKRDANMFLFGLDALMNVDSAKRNRQFVDDELLDGQGDA